MKKLMLLLPTTGYRNDDFLAAANTLQIELIPVANYCHQLAPGWGLTPLQAVPFDQPDVALQSILSALGAKVPDAVLAVDDLGLELASLLCAHFGLPGNPLSAVQILRDKLLFRRFLRQHAFPCPEFFHLPEQAAVPDTINFPVVVKPRRLSGSRGVIRANNAIELTAAVSRVRRIQEQADRQAKALGIVIETFIPGEELAVEGIISEGKLQIIAYFDKPDPLNGPYFEETLYVTSNRIPEFVQEKIQQQIENAALACGIITGPIHAEIRVNHQGIWLLEIAPRSIGGLCGRILRYALGISLEELILREALHLTIPKIIKDLSLGVMMIPIPERGILRSVTGLEAARATEYIVDIQITAERGQILVPLPEGASYLGFIFANAPTPNLVEASLRTAHAQLQFDMAAEMPLEKRREFRA